MKKSYKFLEDIAIADIAYEAYGKNLSELFMNSAEALFASMAEINTVKPLKKYTITLENDSIENLLHDFLSEIVFIKDRDSSVFHDSEVEIQQKGDKNFLVATIYGEPIDEKKQTLGADVKAITMHRFKIEQTEKGFKSTIVLDV